MNRKIYFVFWNFHHWIHLNIQREFHLAHGNKFYSRGLIKYFQVKLSSCLIEYMLSYAYLISHDGWCNVDAPLSSVASCALWDGRTWLYSRKYCRNVSIESFLYQYQSCMMFVGKVEIVQFSCRGKIFFVMNKLGNGKGTTIVPKHLLWFHCNHIHI